MGRTMTNVFIVFYCTLLTEDAGVLNKVKILVFFGFTKPMNGGIAGGPFTIFIDFSSNFFSIIFLMLFWLWMAFILAFGSSVVFLIFCHHAYILMGYLSFIMVTISR